MAKSQKAFIRLQEEIMKQSSDQSFICVECSRCNMGRQLGGHVDTARDPSYRTGVVLLFRYRADQIT
jgi:hypothetical protein